MADSPHSSLSTPTPALLPVSGAPPTPPKPSPSPTFVSQTSSVESSSRSSSTDVPANFSPSVSPTTSFSFQPNNVESTSGPNFSSLASPPNSPRTKSIQRTPTTSPSSSRYQSPLTSPRVSNQDAHEPEEGELDDTDSDVEIYLSSIGIDDTVPRVHVVESTAPEESSDISSVTLEQKQLAINSPQLPPAPVQATIPLPDVGTERQLSPHAGIFHYNPAPSKSPEIEVATKPDIHEDKTPNVYINGLPPHFPEDQLFALASPFGEIRSVRTFTRHVRDSESGYGFVLFETIEAAEKCITSLRRYRNLHPTFSKQVHKIPGTAYSQANIQLHPTPPGSSSSLAGWEQEGRDDLGEDASFKAKMESLHDPTSTNLYMEGLPLSIDEPTLAALVSPHRIVSSRFFQTRLSNPPRIIAFVRLETRVGAEEIIERLHGRMVRGWNDTGSRISVRFSDTAEQRELRRNERNAREGGISPSRITIAQAALLNLHGQGLRSQVNAAPQTRPPIPSLSLDRHLDRPQVEAAHFPEYPSTAYVQTPPFSVDYSLAPGRRQASRSQTPTHTSPYHHHAPLPSDPNMQGMDPAMAALLSSLRGNGVPFQGSGPYTGGQGVYQDHSHRILPGRGSVHVSSEMDYGIGYDHFSGPTRARSGYTATEEYIMRAHVDASMQRRRPPPLDLIRRRCDSDASANINMGVRGYRAQASSVSVSQQQHPLSPSLIDQPLSPMSEDEFHATAARNNEYRQTVMQSNNNVPKHNHRIHPAHVNARLSRDHTSSRQQHQRQQQNPPSLIPSPNPNLHHYQQAHLRSSTLPHRTPSATNHHQRHYQHSSMSIPNSNNNINTPSLPAHDTNNNIFTNKNNTISDAIGIYDDRAEIAGNKVNNNHYDAVKSHRQQHARVEREYSEPQNPAFYEIDQTSPSIVSPSLTYSSHTPSTLSPATPFFGSFQGGQADGFPNAKTEGFVRSAGQGFEGKKVRAGSH